MTGAYWAVEAGRVPADAVLVCVLEAGPDLHDDGESVLARVQWVMVADDEDTLISRSEGPFEMGTALDYAEEIAALYGLQRVVVAIADQTLWQGVWGTLTNPSGPH